MIIYQRKVKISALTQNLRTNYFRPMNAHTSIASRIADSTLSKISALDPGQFGFCRAELCCGDAKDTSSALGRATLHPALLGSFDALTAHAFLTTGVPACKWDTTATNVPGWDALNAATKAWSKRSGVTSFKVTSCEVPDDGTGASLRPLLPNRIIAIVRSRSQSVGAAEDAGAALSTADVPTAPPTPGSPRRLLDIIECSDTMQQGNASETSIPAAVGSSQVDASWTPPWLCRDVPRHRLLERFVFVCCHQVRDARCGYCGPVLVDLLKQEYAKISRSATTPDDGGRMTSFAMPVVHVLPCSHLGGHVYAGNVCMYSRGLGVCLGRVTPADVLTLMAWFSTPDGSDVDAPVHTIDTMPPELRCLVRGSML